MTFACIVAADLNNGIGFQGKLPWPTIPEDFRFFKETTMQTIAPFKQNAVIMGRKTWDSIPEKFRPLPDRLNIVVSSTLQLPPDRALQMSSVDEAVRFASAVKNIENTYVIGGANVYAYAFDHPLCARIYLTRINKIFEADVFIPAFTDRFKFEREIKIGEHNGLEYRFEEWTKK